jgi:hypothetical protein
VREHREIEAKLKKARLDSREVRRSARARAPRRGGRERAQSASRAAGACTVY